MSCPANLQEPLSNDVPLLKGPTRKKTIKEKRRLRQRVITRARPIARRVLWRRGPGWILEIEKVAHVAGTTPPVAGSQSWQFETFFDEFQPGRVIGRDVRNVISFGEW